MSIHRRDLLKAAALSTAFAAPSLRADERRADQSRAAGPRAEPDRAEPAGAARPVAWDAIKQRLRALGAKTGLKIARIETFTFGTSLAVVRVTTDDGGEEPRIRNDVCGSRAAAPSCRRRRRGQVGGASPAYCAAQGAG